MKQASYRENDYSFGQQMRTLRSTIGITQAGLAEILGVSRPSVVEWEAGSKYPKAKHLQAFIALVVQHRAFPAGQEADAIKALWKASRQKILLDEVWLAKILQLQPSPQSNSVMPIPSTKNTRLYWEDALAVDAFYGREWELNLLTEWVISQQCRVITIFGLGGIGKSALTVRLMHQVAEDFDVVIWRSLRDLPTYDELLTDLLQVLIPQEISNPFEQRTTLLMEQLRANRVLLVLDNVESVLEDNELSGHMRPGYEGFGHFLRLCAETRHQSSILLTSRRKPDKLLPYEGNQTPVRTLRLVALDDAACEQLLTERDVAGNPAERNQLIQSYAGNPLALKIVAQTIVDMFDGQIRLFLEQGGVIFGGVRDLLDEQYSRLTNLERRIAFWLAIMREPVTFNQLKSLFVVPLPPATALETMNSLYRHSLIERGQVSGSFTLQSVVLEYLTEQLISEASEEIRRGDFTILYQHGLEHALVKDYVRHTQTRLLIAPLLLRLQNMDIPPLEDHLKALLDDLRHSPQATQGYAPANLLALLRVLRGHLQGLDLSRLVIRNAHLQGVDIQDTDLSHAELRDCSFIETFGALNSLSMSKDGNYWAANSVYGQIWVWEGEGNVLYRMWEVASESIERSAISPDGKLLVGGYMGGNLKLWDIASGVLLWSTGQIGELYIVNSVAFSPNGLLIAATGDDHIIRIWHMEQKKLLAECKGSSQTITLAWRSDSAVLATGDITGMIYLWSVGSDMTLELALNIKGHEQLINGLAFSPDGSRLASASWDSTVRIWDAFDGQLQETLTGHQTWVQGVAWNADGRTIASSGRDGLILLWDVEGRYYRAVMSGHSGTVKALAFTPDSKKLVSASWDATLRVWEIESGQSVRVLRGYNNSLYKIRWSPDGSFLASSGLEPLVTIFPLNDAVPPHFLREPSSAVVELEWSPDGRWLAGSENTGIICVWDTTKHRVAAILSDSENPSVIFTALAWHPDGQYLAVGTILHCVQCFDMSTQPYSRRAFQQVESVSIDRLAWNPDGTYLAGRGSMTIYIWDIEGVLCYELPAHHEQFADFAWSPNGKRLITLDIGGEVLIWDIVNWVSSQVLVLAEPPEYIPLAWGADDDHIIIGGRDGILHWWNIQNGNCIMSIECHQDRIYSIQTSPDRTMVASCGEDGTVVVREAATGQLLKTLRRDRPYERMNISGIKGLTEAQKTTLRQLGAVEAMPH